MWDWLIKLFRELSETSKLVILFVLLLALIAYTVWQILSWRKQRDLKKELKRTKARPEEVTEDRAQLQERLLALDHVDRHVWTKPDQYGNNRFVPREQRRTRFIALVNLKGGVGKTTLTLNLGVSLGQRGKKVLLVDLDFQGTLSNLALPRELVNDYRDKGWTTDALLKANAAAPVQSLLFAVQEAGNCRAMIAREHLELVEFERQSRFFVNPEQEARFLLQKALHVPEIFEQFDYVLFDCPPRMSTACINALTCSDYVLVPSTLSQLDIEAVPRTLKSVIRDAKSRVTKPLSTERAATLHAESLAAYDASPNRFPTAAVVRSYVKFRAAAKPSAGIQVQGDAPLKMRRGARAKKHLEEASPSGENAVRSLEGD
jgi:cellulose biosynthesis protein BcsQ